MYCLSFVKNVKRHIKICAGALLLILSSIMMLFADTQAVKPSEPYSKILKNGWTKEISEISPARLRGKQLKRPDEWTDFVFHNFIGKEPDIIPSSQEDDVERYFEQGITYIQEQFDNFNKSLSDRPKAQRYFAKVKFKPEIKIDNSDHEISSIEKMDYYINQISKSCELVLSDVAKYVSICTPEYEVNEYSSFEQQIWREGNETFVLAYRALLYGAYKELIGDGKKYERLAGRCESEKKLVLHLLEIKKDNYARWVKQALEGTDRPDIKFNREKWELGSWQSIASYLNTWLVEAVEKMHADTSSPILEEITVKDLQNVINLSLLIGSLEAMHDITDVLMGHNEQKCRLSSDSDIVRKMNAIITEVDLKNRIDCKWKPIG